MKYGSFEYQLAGIVGFALIGAVVAGTTGFLVVALLGALWTLFRVLT